MFSLEGRAALVTGAGQNAGAGIARALAHQGAKVAVNDLYAERAEAVCAQITESRGTALALPFDVTDLDVARAATAQAKEKFGQHLDILVNNAGIPADIAHGPFRSIDPARWRHPIDLNIYGSINCVKAVIDDMCEAGWGRVVQISSGSARTGQNAGVSMYATGKSGVEGFIRHLSAEVAGHGVTANVLALGLMNNLESAKLGDELDQIRATIPVGRLGSPEDAGAACAFLASSEAGWLTGQTIDLNGGTQTR
ncbi:SDR family NAD(P)-dependent oxidoreductase [Nocardiopsis dassonvillei]|uniref:SDR family NAD(P)-dependent oxidoreductase n=1 Tax=Nocardiopsis dassonvillei TaxID=2014 RepID=UPI00366AABA5